MADIADEQTQQILRTIVREETRTIIREETRAIFQKEGRAIIRDETQDMREDIKLIKHVQGQQSIMLHALTTDVRQIKLAVRDHTVRLHDLESVGTSKSEA